jgi:HSP20 family protein
MTPASALRIRPTGGMNRSLRSGYARFVARRRDIDRLQGEIEELFAELWQVPRFSGLRAGFRPLVDVYRTEDPAALTIVVEVPGVDPDSLHVELGEHQLLIAGTRPPPKSPSRVYQQMEIEYGAFERRVPLAEPVDVDASSASYDSGMLTLVLPLAPQEVAEERVTIVIRRGV